MLRKARDGGRRESDGAKGPAPVDRKNKKTQKTGGLGAGQRVFLAAGPFSPTGGGRSAPWPRVQTCASLAGGMVGGGEGGGGGRNESREGAAPNVIMQWLN